MCITGRSLACNAYQLLPPPNNSQSLYCMQHKCDNRLIWLCMYTVCSASEAVVYDKLAALLPWWPCTSVPAHVPPGVLKAAVSFATSAVLHHSRTTAELYDKIIQSPCVSINSVFLFCGFRLFVGVERPWWPCHHLSAVLWKPHSERLWWQHAQGVVCCHWQGEGPFIFDVIVQRWCRSLSESM